MLPGPGLQVQALRPPLAAGFLGLIAFATPAPLTALRVGTLFRAAIRKYAPHPLAAGRLFLARYC